MAHRRFQALIFYMFCLLLAPLLSISGVTAMGLPTEVEQDYQHLLRQWNELYAHILKEEKAAQNSFRDATNSQFKAGEKLRTAESNKALVEPDQLASLHEDYEKAVLLLKKEKMHQKEIKSLVEKARKINYKLSSMDEKRLNKTRSQFNLVLAKYGPEQPVIPDQAPPKEPPATPKAAPLKEPSTPVKANGSIVVAAYDPKMIDTRPSSFRTREYRSQPIDCSFETDTIDASSGTQRRELTPGLLFTHTDPDLRPYFKDKDLITCLARLSKIGPYVYLTIEFQIASSHSQSNFGSLDEGSLLRFKMIDGDYVSLYNLKSNSGRIDPYTGYTVFAGQYALGKSELNKLEVGELDKMRVMWSTGFEDYEVVNVDFLIHQMDCLMNGK